MNTLKQQIFFMQYATMKMHCSYIIWSLAYRPNELLKLRFEDFEDKDGKICIVLCKQEEPKEEVQYLWSTLSTCYELLSDEGKQWNISNKIIYNSHWEKKLQFFFNLTRSKLQKKISRKFAMLIPDMKSKPKNIRMSSISNEFKDYKIQRSSSLELHTSAKTTQVFYIRILKDFK